MTQERHTNDINGLFLANDRPYKFPSGRNLTENSHVGNIIFPRWESTTSLRIANKQHLCCNKGPLLQHKAPLLPLFMSLVCRFYVINLLFLCHFKILQASDNKPNTQLLCHMSLVFKISAKIIKMTIERLPQGRRSILFTKVSHPQKVPIK